MATAKSVRDQPAKTPRPPPRRRRAVGRALAAVALLLLSCSPPPEPAESPEQRQQRRSCVDRLVSECGHAREDAEAYSRCLTNGMRECAGPR